ncbi:o-linked n-acetylglucosamine transferase, ogt, putative [Ricinus communis]|uniref:O-linked n-acetylglucosamine transferase, ogt, putative n=1 Tax=Ricinus communis TaxID=3988 RepID=B9SQS9_RICCO|nr:o-linked n-acetylglucosamine transferase, ogt, putative [Ricinus communis]
MILRSSSNPVTGTFLSPFSSSDSPNRDFHDHNKLSSSHGFHHLNLTPISCTNSSSPISEHNDSFRLGGFRRAWSDSNLEKFVYPSSSSDHKEELQNFTSHTPKRFTKRNYTTMLQTAPSFSIFNVNDHELQDQEKNGVEEEERGLMRTVTIGDIIEGTSNGELSFEKKSMGLIEEEGEEEQDQEVMNEIENLNLENVKEPVSPPMYLASGLGIDGIDFGGGGRGGGGFDSTLPNFDESDDLEEYYKRMVDEFPCHPLFLANYAQLLQSKGDLHGAEEYYYRATVADPEDGEILMKYAKLEWQLHHDQDRAWSNFERAIQAAPQDSHVLAAYASFLWEIDGDGEEDRWQTKHIQLPPGLIMDVDDDAASATNKGFAVEEYYKKMVEENPSNSLVLRNYAQFLYQAKGDIRGAEEYYSRALLADPGDGEIKSQYAKLVWELGRDRDKASSYFEQAVQAAPGNSNVLAAYASFLWETEENEEDSTCSDQFQEVIHHESSVTAATA